MGRLVGEGVNIEKLVVGTPARCPIGGQFEVRSRTNHVESYPGVHVILCQIKPSCLVLRRFIAANPRANPAEILMTI